MTKFISIILAVIFLSCNQATDENPHIRIITSLGDIEVELYPKQAPKTVAAFLSFVDSGFYKNSSFYRVLLTEGFSTDANIGLIQGGIWQTNEAQHPAVPGIVHESTRETGLSHTSGTISLARTAPGTANTEFFICIGDQTQFDFGNNAAGDSLGFAAFGQVSKGMAIARKIQLERKHDQHFDQKVIIQNIERL